MTLELGNFKYDGERFYIDGKHIKFSRMRYKILKLLTDNYKMMPVKPAQIIHELYYDKDYYKDEPDTESYKVILHSIRKTLRTLTENKLTITANKGLGYTLDYNPRPVKPYKCRLTDTTKEAILNMHMRGSSSSFIANHFGISKHKVYDILIRSKQNRRMETAFGDNYKKRGEIVR